MLKAIKRFDSNLRQRYFELGERFINSGKTLEEAEAREKILNTAHQMFGEKYRIKMFETNLYGDEIKSALDGLNDHFGQSEIDEFLKIANINGAKKALEYANEKFKQKGINISDKSLSNEKEYYVHGFKIDNEFLGVIEAINGALFKLYRDHKRGLTDSDFNFKSQIGRVLKAKILLQRLGFVKKRNGALWLTTDFTKLSDAIHLGPVGFIEYLRSLGLDKEIVVRENDTHKLVKVEKDTKKQTIKDSVARLKSYGFDEKYIQVNFRVWANKQNLPEKIRQKVQEIVDTIFRKKLSVEFNKLVNVLPRKWIKNIYVAIDSISKNEEEKHSNFLLVINNIRNMSPSEYVENVDKYSANREEYNNAINNSNIFDIVIDRIPEKVLETKEVRLKRKEREEFEIKESMEKIMHYFSKEGNSVAKNSTIPNIMAKYGNASRDAIKRLVDLGLLEYYGGSRNAVKLTNEGRIYNLRKDRILNSKI